MGVKHRGVCVESSKQTRNSTTNPKLDNKPKSREQKIVGWALRIVVCAWNVRNKPKTRKQKVVEDKSNLLQKVGKSKTKKVKSKTIHRNKSKAKDQIGN